MIINYSIMKKIRNNYFRIPEVGVDYWMPIPKLNTCNSDNI